MATWHAAHVEPAAKIHCEFRGGADLPEKYRGRYRPASPCLGEFDRKNPREKYCDNCKPVARRWQQLQAALNKYHEDEKKAAKRALKSRLKRRKAQGRPVRVVLGRLYSCAYRKNRKRGEGCLGKFKAKSSAQKFCTVCQKHADADRAAAWREKHPDEEKARGVKRWKTLMEDAARGKSFRPDARGLTPLTKLRITLAACLAADGLSEYAMTNKLNPGTKETFAKRRGTLKSFWEDHRGEYEREKGRVSALAKTERDAIAAEAERKIQDELQSRFTRQRRLIH